MKTSILSALAAASALMAVTPASAAETFFQGSTDGCFGTGCVGASTATSGGLTFNDSTFSGTTSSGFLSVGGMAATPNIDNLGSFTLSSAANSYAGTVFNLLVNFTSPTGTNPASRRFGSILTGSVSADSTGGVFIDFDNTAQNFTFHGGTFSLFVNDLSIIGGQTAPLTGTIIAQAAQVPSVPEASTWAMMLLGFGAVGFALRRRRSEGALLAQLA